MLVSSPLLDLIGLRPIRVDDLGRDALLIASCGLVLIDSAVTGARLDAVVDRVLSMAAGALTRH